MNSININLYCLDKWLFKLTGSQLDNLIWVFQILLKPMPKGFFPLNIFCRQRPALGQCLAAFSAAFPVAFLEHHMNKFNSFSVYNSRSMKSRKGTIAFCSSHCSQCLHEYGIKWISNDFYQLPYVYATLTCLYFIISQPPVFQGKLKKSVLSSQI